jgi:hypothetical protein
MTDPPWLPVAPKTTRIFLDDILYLSCWKCKIWMSRVTFVGYLCVDISSKY